MKTSIVFGAMIVCAASLGMAQAAEPPAAGMNTQAASANHDPYYPMVSPASIKSRAQVLTELKSARMNGDLMQFGHEAHYPDQSTR